MMRPGVFFRRSMAARCTPAPKATPRWRTPPCPPWLRCFNSMPPCPAMIQARAARRDRAGGARVARTRQRAGALRCSSGGNGSLLYRGDRRLHRRGLRRQVFRNDGGIERGHRRIRQSEPDLILAEQRDTHIAAHGERLAVGADGHLGLVDLAVARIENVAVLIFQSVALHVADEGHSEHRRVLAVVGAFCANHVGIFARAAETSWRSRPRRCRRDRPPGTSPPACRPRSSATARRPTARRPAPEA